MNAAFHGPALLREIEEAVEHYVKSASTVGEYLDGLYIRATENPDDVRLSELLFVCSLRDDGVWMHPNTAANQCYHLIHRLGHDTTGHAGF